MRSNILHALHLDRKGSIHQIAMVIAFVFTMLAGALTVSLDTIPEKKQKAIRTVRVMRSNVRRSRREILDIWNE